jgi:hypothetical protein
MKGFRGTKERLYSEGRMKERKKHIIMKITRQKLTWYSCALNCSLSS